MPRCVTVVSACFDLRPAIPMPAVRATSWHHTSLAVGDLDAGIAFYRDTFGYEVAFQEKGMSDRIARMTGIEGLTCDLAQLRSIYGEHVLALIAFRRPGRDVPPLDGAALRTWPSRSKTSTPRSRRSRRSGPHAWGESPSSMRGAASTAGSRPAPSSRWRSSAPLRRKAEEAAADPEVPAPRP